MKRGCWQCGEPLPPHVSGLPSCCAVASQESVDRMHVNDLGAEHDPLRNDLARKHPLGLPDRFRARRLVYESRR